MSQQFPLNDKAYDVIAVMYQKSKALEVYSKYIEDAGNDPELKNLLSQISAEDKQHVEQLKKCLGRLLSKGS